MTTLQAVELGVLGPLQVRQGGAPVAVPGAKPRAILTMLGLHAGSIVAADTLIELLWGEDPPRTAAKALQTHISSLRRALGDGFVLTEGTGWKLSTSETDASRYKRATRLGRDAAATGETSQAVARFEEARSLWRGTPELPDTRRGVSEKTRWIEGHAALVEDRADALLTTGRAAELIGELEAAVADAPLRERRWGQLMLALYRAGRQGEALAAYQRARSLLADELGVDPGPELRRLETAIVAQDAALDIPVAQNLSTVTRAVTFLLTDIEGSTAAWEADAEAMAVALARHDELVEQVVTSRGGRLIKTRGEGDATFSVFDRPSAAAAAAIELQDAIGHEPWVLREPMRVRVALHTGEAELRDGDYFGRAVNRAARLRSLAEGGQILCSGATAELVIDSLSDDVLLFDLGMRQLKNLARPEHVFELRLETAESPAQEPTDAPLERPGLPAVLTGPGPFVGRGPELEGLVSGWQTALAGGTHAVLIAGEPGVGKTRLAGEWSRHAYEQGAVVLYGRCDEDLGAPYQPFAEALRSLVPCLAAKRLRGMRGVEALLALVPGLTDVLPDLAAPTRADPDTERYALFDAVVALCELASASAPVVLILDDLHWAAKPTLLLLRHLLRFGDHARMQIVGTYRSTDLDRSHPLAAMLADLHRDGTANRLQLSGLGEDDVTAFVAEAGYDDEELARALASVTGGNPFFLIEALRHVDESGGVWDPSTLPQGVRETVSRRLSRLSAETNTALAAAAVVGSRFPVELVERVVDQDLVDQFDEACKAGIVIEEPGGRYRFNHAIVRQSLLAELASVRRLRLHQRIAMTLETQPGADDELLAELAYHYFECAWAGNAAKAVDYCRRAADQAMARLAYEGAADLYDRALHALEEIDDELPDRNDQVADLLIARCEALLAAGDVTTATGAVAQLQRATADSARLAAWATCFDGELSMLVHPERLDDIETALAAAAGKLAELDDAAGEAKAHTVRATCLARLGRVGDCEIALDDALTAARRAGEHRRVNAVLAGAPLAALWGPNPVPRAGGRCLDVVRLLRITTDSPAVEATSTRCQAVLEAFRGRAEAARRMIDSARRTVTELGLRHALVEVEQFAGIVELVAGDPAAAEPHLRQAYNGFRRMGLDADTAETAALLGRACLVLNQEAEADELCTESERLAGNALKPSIAWRTLRARLLSRRGDHDEAKRIAEAAVALAERTDALVDHGDACLSLATVLGAAGDNTAARATAERAADLYERKGAAALAERARSVLGERIQPIAPTPPETPAVEFHTAAAEVSKRAMAAIDRENWDEFERLVAPEGSVESRRKVVGFKKNTFSADDVQRQTRRDLETGIMRASHVVIAVRGERLALARVTLGTADLSDGAPRDEFLHLYSVNEQGRIALQIWFDVDDMDAAIAELDALHARFEAQTQRQVPRLENAASRVYGRWSTYFANRNWAAITEMLADGMSSEDRRRVVNSGLRQGRDAAIAEMMALAGTIGVKNFTSDHIAIRGERLVLSRTRTWGRDQRPDAFHTDALDIVEIDADERVVARVVFELDDFDAAIAELDARYLNGEAASYAETWSSFATAFAGFNRRQLKVAPGWVNVDHRRGAAFEAGDMAAYIDDLWNDSPDVTMYVEVVRRLSNLGVVITQAAHGTSQQGFEAEWRANSIFTFDGDLVSRCELFDEEDLGGALARFDQLGQPARRLENAASRVFESEWSHFAARDWDALAELVAHNYSGIDHRRVVRAENQHGRDVVVNDLQAAADVGFTISMVSAIAIRGERLVLARVRACGRDPKAIQNDALNVIEIDAEERIVAAVTFDLEDFDAAIAELDARYLAGEAAAHAHAWSVIMRAYAAVNRHEIAPTTPNFASIDHRQGTKFAPGDLIAYLRATWDLEQQDSTYVEAVHRLDSFGAVVTHVTRGSSKDGFDAEWREVFLLTIEGELLSRCELFDEADLDTAIARFEELSRPAPGLENSAIRTLKRYFARFAARDWDVMAEELTDDFLTDDRRRVVNAGVRRGRDPEIANMQSFAEIGMLTIAPIALATRGERLVLCRHYVSFRDWAEPSSDVIGVVEINPDNEICAHIMFDANDFDAAMAELDARYLTGEAADHARTWSLVEAGYAALNRHELPATTRDWVDIDHRPVVPIETGDLGASLRAVWDDLAPQAAIYVETVHRLNTLGAVMTHVVQTTSRDGFDAEWRDVALVTFEGDKINRCEVFDEADLDTAIAKFDQLSRPAPGLENRASQVAERFLSYFASCDLDAMAQLQADDISIDDRRPVVNAGIRRGRDAAVQDARANADVGAKKVASTVIATRGERLALCRARYSGGAEPSETYHVDVLSIYEIDADERIAAVVTFGPNDFDAAFDELDVRYLAGEAAPYAHTWAAVAAVFVAVKRHEMSPTTPNFVDIDRRRLAVEAGGFEAYLHSIWDVTDYVSVRITAVHRLTALGAVVTHASHAISHEGLDAEWQNVNLLTFDGDMVSRSELFDEADLDAAIARFEELHPTTRRLENTASRVFESEWSHFAARDWDALGELVADNYSGIDHRRVVNTENQYGRDAVVRDLQAAADVGFAISMLSAMAIRGERLVLARICASGRGPDGIRDEALNVIEIDTDDRIVAASTFDLEDIDAAFAELDARYLAGEAAPYAQTWTLTLRTFAAVNRQELPPTTPDWVNVDHRPVVGSHVGEVWAALRAVWELVPEVAVNIEAVHQLSDSGAVVTFAARGVSGEGFDAEWRAVTLITFEGDLLKRGEVFAEADLAAALAKFAELNRPTTHLENTASRVDTRFQACFAARDWDAMAEMVSDGFSIEDRRRVVNMGNLQGRDAELGVHSYAVVGSENVKATVIATRAQRLALSHYRFSGPDQRPDAFRIEMLALVEIDADDRMAAVVVFDADDIDAAFAELDARYRVGEAAAHARTWSVIASAIAAHNRREIAPTTPDVMTIDHRRAAAFAPGEGIDYLRAGWDLDQTLNIYIETAHRLSDRGAVFTWTGQGRSREGFAAEWRGVNLMLVDGEMVARSEVFDAEDLETALAKFDQLTRPAPRLENEASQAAERFRRCFAARDWDGLAQVLAEDMVADDRRRVVGIGIRRGRQANVADVRAGADLGTEDITSTPIATRGDRIFLDRARFSANDQQPDALSMELLRIVEVDAENRYTRCLMFDVDDFEAAFTELDARYIAGEAAAHSDVWSAVAGSYAALNRREPPLTTPDCVNVDHRRETAFGPGDLAAYIHTGLDLDPGIVIYVEQVHRLTDIGAIVTYAAHETSQEGFQAEWRGIAVFTVEGGRVNRTEVFDESHIEAAIARFEELSRPAPRLENAASRVGDRFFAHFAAGEWDAMAEILADNLSNEDRRRVVSTGIFDGRDAQMANMRTVAELWSTTATRTVMAIRGTNLSLARVSFWRGEGVEAFLTEFLAVMEIDADERILATVVFDVDDFDAAIAELDARYLAGEAAPYSAVWSVVMEGYAALNRHERPLLTPDVVSADHRRGRGFAPGDLPAWLDASWELMPQSSLYIEDVHRLNDIGIVVTHVVHGTTAEGFVAEWREINLLKAAGDRVSRCEVFDEDDLDAALASFEEFSRPALRLENAATRTVDRVNAYFGARDWEALGAIMAPDVVDEDRRRVANAGLRQGRDAVVGGVQTAADLGAQHIRSTAIATRGDRLALSRSRYSGRDQRPEAFYSEALGVFEIDVDGRVVAHVAFDLQDIDAAFEELETRYLAGEAAANAHTWSLVRRAYAALNRRELPPTAQDWVDIDHRRLAPIAAGDLGAYLRATWDLSPQSGIYIETVHRLSKVGAVVTHVVKGTSQQGFDAEWRTIDLSMYEGDQIKRSELFDETDLEAAIARFDELNRPAPRLENAASQVDNRFNAYFTARDWAAMRGVLADDVWADDRRRVVNAGVVRGSEALIANMQAIADVGAADPTWTFIATRGERLVLVHQRMSSRGPELFHIEMFAVVEINADNRISSVIAFDVDDLEVAVAELDSRYLASEAAAHAHTWSVIAAGYAALNRREVPESAPGYVIVDHQLRATINLEENLSAAWDLTPDLKGYVESVHRLSDAAAVVTHAADGTSQDGVHAEWRGVHLLTLDGGMVNRAELFDEADLDVALARFDELHPKTPRLENAASRMYDRSNAYLAACEWDAIAELLAHDISTDDRRRVVGSGIRRGRDAQIANLRAIGGVGVRKLESVVIATRGERLALCRTRGSGGGQLPEAFSVEMLNVVEINADNRITAAIQFDPDDVNAAIAELDARYVAGEAAPYARTWSVIAGEPARFSRHELPAATPDPVYVDRRKLVSIEGVDLAASVRAVWDITSGSSIHIEVVHRLSELGAVFTYVLKMTSHEGFDAEVSMIMVFTVEGDLISRVEVFDEEDLDAALARFVELHPQGPRLENMATRANLRFFGYFTIGDWVAIAQIFAGEILYDDRRPVVSGGSWQGRDLVIDNMRAISDFTAENLGFIATRGKRLSLSRMRWSNSDPAPDSFHTEVLVLIEVDADELIARITVFDPEDIDSAFEELDARYLAGEAAAHARTWSVISRLYAGFNRHNLPATTPDWTYVDHRSVISVEASDLPEFISVGWELTPEISIHMETVHRLSDLGAVVTHTARGMSSENFEVEWRMIDIFTVDGDCISGCEMFDEADLDAALARFDQMHPQSPRLENAASQVAERYWSYFAARDWDNMAELLADDISTDDRRRVVSAGSQRGRDFDIASMRALADIGVTNAALSVIATRGGRLALSRIRLSGRDQRPDAFHSEALGIAEIDADGRLVAHVAFDPEDVRSAFAELDARYLAGEAASHSQTWSALTRAYALINRHELPSTTPDWVNIDHRRGRAFVAGDMSRNIRAAWQLAPNTSFYFEAVHRLSNLGVVVTSATHGTSFEGFDAEWRQIDVLMFADDRISRCELFDESDLDAALARFDELHPQATQLDNAASRAERRFFAYWGARNWAAMAEMLAEDSFIDDTRRNAANVGFWDGRDVVIANMQALADAAAPEITTLTVIATRGDRLVLTHRRSPNHDPHEGEFVSEGLIIAEIDADDRIKAHIQFDVDDVDAAFAELDARYLAGEAAAYADTWSRVTSLYATVNRHELPAMTTDSVVIDHRSLISIETVDMAAFFGAVWELTRQVSMRVEAAHRLNSLGAVVTLVVRGTSEEGSEVEWRLVAIVIFEGDRLSRSEVFDEADLGGALARFEELQPQSPRLENAAIHMSERVVAHFAAAKWDALAEILADDFIQDDRRRVLGAGVRRGREAQIADVRAIAGLFGANLTSTPMATRGERLALTRLNLSNRDQRADAYLTEMLAIGEINADGLLVAYVSFDPEDFEAAFEELDARYLAGEAAAYAQTWSVVTQAYSMLNRRELPPVRTDWVNIDHRALVSIEGVDLAASLRALWDITSASSFYVEAVHRLDELGAVATTVVKAVTPEGLDAEVRMIAMGIVKGQLFSRVEYFDEADLDAALERFEELHHQVPRLENVASRVWENFQASNDRTHRLAMTAERIVTDDRRPVVGAGVQRGREVNAADMRAFLDIGMGNMTSTVIATRGERLILDRFRLSGRDQAPEPFYIELLRVLEIDADNRIAACIAFALDDIDAAFEELDTRYLAGEAAAHSHIWSVMTQVQVAYNRHEFPPTTEDWINLDHRLGRAFAPGEMIPYMHATYDVVPNIKGHIEAVHRLSHVGVVITEVVTGTSEEGFDFEWREVALFAFDGDTVCRFEMFDETDLDAALARFDELEPPARRLENAAVRVYKHFFAHYAKRDWAALAAIMTENSRLEDRRRAVNAGLWSGRDVFIENFRATDDFALEDLGVVATRGQRLFLGRYRWSPNDPAAEMFYTEAFCIVEICTDERIQAFITFELDDADAAFAELDSRYIAGEAAVHAQTWSAIAKSYAAVNRREMPPTTPDWVNIDHRRGIAFAPGETLPYLRATWDVAPFQIYIESVHRLTALGAVVSWAAHGTSEEGFDAEWRGLNILTTEADLVNRLEVFDEADLETALARFEELHRHAPRPENAASRLEQRFSTYFAARDWDALTELLSDNISVDDRRPVVNVGTRHGRDAEIANMRAVVAVGVTNMTPTVIATRGTRLVLGRYSIVDNWSGSTALCVSEINAENQIAARVVLGPDDIDAAFEELESRYLAGEAAAQAHTWSVIARTYSMVNRHEVPAMDFVTLDHRRGTPYGPGDLTAAMRLSGDLTPDLNIYNETVHRLSEFGAVITNTAHGTSKEGFAAEWRTIQLVTVEGDRINRLEIFDESDLDAALARFEELDRP